MTTSPARIDKAVIPYGDYIVFADESGDHSLTSVDADYPIFVLCFCIIEKSHYLEKIVPEIHRIKMRYFGHDQIIFHERDLVKKRGDFGALPKIQREALLQDLGTFMEQASIHLIATVIHKNKLKERYAKPYNPYHIGLKFCLERTSDFLLRNGQEGKLTHIVAESRGKNEDGILRKEFMDITSRLAIGDCHWGWRSGAYDKTPLALYFSAKGANSPGVQIADLTARPIGLSRLRPEQSNRAFEIISPKLCATIKEFP